MTALVGGVGTSASAAAATAVAPAAATNGRYDFDTVYNRVGTDCV